MKIKHFIVFSMLFQSILTLAQQPMVAYRKEGIWHYFDTNGKLMWQPYLDVASFPNGWHNGLLKAAAMDIKTDKVSDIQFERKQVLYDKKGKVAFQPKYNSPYRIVSGFDKSGYIQLREMEGDTLILCDKQGNVVYKSPHGFAHYLGDGVVEHIEKADNTEGDKIHVLFDIKTKTVLSKINCIGFYGHFEQGVVFSFSENSFWGMVNRYGKEVQPMVWESDLLREEEDNVFKEKYIALQHSETKKWHLLNKNGETVLKDFQDNFTLKNGFFTCYTIGNDIEKLKSFRLLETEIKEIDGQYGAGTQITEGGNIACENDESEVTILNKNLKKLAVLKGIKEIKSVDNFFWIKTDKDDEFDVFNENAQKIASIRAETIAQSAYNHVPFMQNGKWGLAHKSGKIIVKPQFEFNTEEVPKVENGFWSINVTLPDNNHRFDFYNFQGQLALSTTAEKDGWDYILTQETVSYYYRTY